MDCEFKMESNKYVISLDNLDLALLPTFYSSRSSYNTAKLWSNANLNGDNYFEFEVKPKTEATCNDEETTVNDDVPTNQCNEYSQYRRKLIKTQDILTTCHICDIEFPAAYLNDHENSQKHKAYLKISEVVLDRTRKYMLKRSSDYVQKKDTMYFCGPCAIEIHIANKNSHEKSKTHKLSVSVDRLLCELVTLYTDQEYEHGEELSLNKKSLDDHSNVVKHEFDRNIENSTLVIGDSKPRLNEFHMETVQDYIKMINNNVDKYYTLSSVGNDLKISMHDDCQVIVSLDNFNGFVAIDDIFTSCIVCKITIENEEAHMISDKHMKNVMKPFRDRNCLRYLDNISSHCVICNIIVNNSEIHITCDNIHIELLQKALTVNVSKRNKHKRTDNTTYNGTDKDSQIYKDTKSNQLLQSLTVDKIKPKTNENEYNVTNVVTEETYHCFICDIKMHVNNVRLHIKGKKHLMNFESKKHYIMKQQKDSNNLLCRVCDISVVGDTNNVIKHLETTEHKLKYKNVLSNNCIIVQKDNFYCKVCEKIMLIMKELWHIEDPNHQSKLNIYNETRAKTNTMNQNNVANNGIKASDKNTYYYCFICKVNIPNNFYNINDHNGGARHTKNVLKIKAEQEDTIENNVVSMTAVDLTVHYEMDPTENKLDLLCKVCKVLVLNSESSVTTHIKGKIHEVAFKRMLDKNQIECVNAQYSCKICKLFIKNEDLFTHIDEVQHKTSFSDLEQKPDLTETVDTSDSQAAPSTSKDKQSNIINEVKPEPMNELYLKFKKLLTETENKDRLHCQTCPDTIIPNTEEAAKIHTTSQSHLNQYKKLMADNLIFETEEQTHFCAICECSVPLTGEVPHAKGLRHNKNYTLAISEEFCKVCNVHTSNMSEHITMLEHVTRLMKTQTLLHYCTHCKALMQKNKAEDHLNNCHKFTVKDKICFCTICDPPLPS